MENKAPNKSRLTLTTKFQLKRPPRGLDEARQLYALLNPALKEALTGQFGSTYEVAVEKVGDFNDLINDLTNEKSEQARKQGALCQLASIDCGKTAGAEVTVGWETKNPAKVEIEVRSGSKVEQNLWFSLTVYTAIAMAVVGCILPLRGAFILTVVLGGLFGATIGYLSYVALSMTVLNALLKRHRAKAFDMARQLNECSLPLVQKILDQWDSAPTTTAAAKRGPTSEASAPAHM